VSQHRNSARIMVYLRHGLGNMLISIKSLYGFQRPRSPSLILLQILVMVVALNQALAMLLVLVLVPVLAMARTRR